MNDELSRKPRVLFICKKRGTYSLDGPEPVLKSWSSGLLNSATFVSNMLNATGVAESKVVDVDDYNAIDREVHRFKPSHTFLEAIWVLPKKFEVLKRLHPRVKWVLRVHSDFPFLAGEGNAIEWLFQYLKHGVLITANKRSTAQELGRLRGHDVPYLPNYYPVSNWWHEYPKLIRNVLKRRKDDYIHIGCFGSLRPLKNQLVQAVAAIKFADVHNQKLKFYINTGRIEGCGEPVLKNIRALFRHSKHELIEIPWLKHDDFIELLESKIDLSMQVSLSETFNIVIADSVASKVPVVVSKEVHWVTPECMVDQPQDLDEIVGTMRMVCRDKKRIVRVNKDLLIKEGIAAKTAWRWFFAQRKKKN